MSGCAQVCVAPQVPSREAGPRVLAAGIEGLVQSFEGSPLPGAECSTVNSTGQLLGASLVGAL